MDESTWQNALVGAAVAWAATVAVRRLREALRGSRAGCSATGCNGCNQHQELVSLSPPSPAGPPATVPDSSR